MLYTKVSRWLIATCLLGILIFSASCTADTKSGAISGGRDVMRLPGVATSGELESEDSREDVLAVVTDINTADKTVFARIIGGRTAELKYNGGTDIRDGLDEAISISQIIIGNVVYIDYDAASMKLKKMKVSSDEWKMEVSGVGTNTDGSYVTYKNEKYTYDDNLVVISDNREYELEDIELIDNLIIYGRDKKIDSIIIDRGHGYLRLENTGFYEGGIIEVGDEVITGIEKNMRLLVPEGTFRLTVTKGDDTGTREITIERDGEQTVDLAELQDEGKRYGNIEFKITPGDAALYIDKNRVNDYSDMVELTYGQHEIIVAKDGYKVHKETVNVDSVYMSLEIELEESEEETTQSASETQDTETGTESASAKNSTEKETAEDTTTVSLANIVNDILQ